jgi:hypothetical protein
MGPSYSRGTAYRNTPAGAMFNTTLSAFNTTLSAAKSANRLGAGLLRRAATGAQFIGREIIHIDEIRDLGIVIP